MGKNRRKHTRRTQDKILTQTVKVLQNLQRLSGGEDVDYTEDYADLVGMKDHVGRREEDEKLVTHLCSTVEALASNISGLLKEEQSNRNVRITQASGKNETPLRSFITIEGWEAEQPKVGEIYRVYLHDGGVFATSPVTAVKSDYFKTQNSLYRIEILPS
jgi:hypothetical protein